MDELIAVGTAGLVVLAFIAVLGIAVIWGVAAVAWTAFAVGDWEFISRLFVFLVLCLSGYTLIGFWLRKNGSI